VGIHRQEKEMKDKIIKTGRVFEAREFFELFPGWSGSSVSEFPPPVKTEHGLLHRAYGIFAVGSGPEGRIRSAWMRTAEEAETEFARMEREAAAAEAAQPPLECDFL
jgi:hypothetical protein